MSVYISTYTPTYIYVRTSEVILSMRLDPSKRSYLLLFFRLSRGGQEKIFSEDEIRRDGTQHSILMVDDVWTYFTLVRGISLNHLLITNTLILTDCVKKNLL